VGIIEVVIYLTVGIGALTWLLFRKAASEYLRKKEEMNASA